ncbi:MAG: hypothetical protein CVT64_02730 [Actinobacteria bacterium HGW-Actinobacteria-4]|nr:MAG: hypothetical protein CVT64_02730 [Actinobacteria bacterium HGW-Actinobacteria-4]
MTDPDLDDDPPRYSQGPKGGWQPIGETVRQLLLTVESREHDIFTESSKLPMSGRFSRDQERIVYEWFTFGQSPQIDPRRQEWINGRHRTWGLAQAGFPAIPVFHLSMGDLVHFWHRDPEIWGTLDAESIRWQRKRLRWWSESPKAAGLRALNPNLPQRWSRMIGAWEQRLGFT